MTQKTTGKMLGTKYCESLDSLDIDLLIAHALGKSREFLLTRPEYSLSASEYAQAIEYLDRRANHEPIAYILGHKEFYGLDFIVNRHTLIPRPETELMIDEAMAILAENKESLIIDVGTGSGNIIVTLATLLLRKKNINAQLFGLDISPEALEVAKRNAARHSVDDQITFLQSDLLEAFSRSVIPGLTRDPGSTEFKYNSGSRIKCGMTLQSFRSKHILILANLPYLSQAIYQSAESDVTDYEPRTALVSDEEGLAHYRQLLEQVKHLLNEKILSPASLTLIFEISPEQHPLIETIIRESFPDADISFIQDYSQRFRFVKITR